MRTVMAASSVLVMLSLPGCVTATSNRPTLPAGFKEAMYDCAKIYRGVSIRETASGQPVYFVDRLQTADEAETVRGFQGCVEGKVGKPLNWRNY